jgi:hypothetical protein
MMGIDDIDRLLHCIKNTTLQIVFSLVVLGADREGALFERERVTRENAGPPLFRLPVP